MLLNVAVLGILNLAAVGEAAARPWKEAGPNDSRGPCPMLNTLANHGYLYVKHAPVCTRDEYFLTIA